MHNKIYIWVNPIDMKLPSKKEIRLEIEMSLSQVLELIGITDPSKKTEKMIKKASQSLAEVLKKEIKKAEKKNKKDTAIKNIKPKKSMKAKGKPKVKEVVVEEAVQVAS